MSATGLSAFDSTLQKTHEWLNAIAQELGIDSRQRAYLSLRAGLHTLRDRLTVDEVAHLGAQLPMLIRGIYYEGWRPSDSPIKWRTKAEFVEHIREYFQTTPNPEDVDVDPERVARAVFLVLGRCVSSGELDSLRLVLPEELAELLPEPSEQTARGRGSGR